MPFVYNVDDTAVFLVPRKIAATRNPGVTDDSTLGFSPGDTWVNTTAGTVFICTSSATGAAVWLSV